MKTEETNLYICQTHYHLLIAIIKQIKSNTCSDIIIAADYTNGCLFNDKLLMDRLIRSKIFRKVITFDYTKKEKVKVKNLFTFNRIRLGNKIIRKKTYNLFIYKDIYVFYEDCLMGYILNKQKIKYHILEDGMDYLKCKYKEAPPMKRINNKKSVKKHIKKCLSIYQRFESPNIKSIEVNNKEDIWVRNPNIIECSKKDLFFSLSFKDKKEILKIFLDKPDELLALSNSVLILTQPLSEDTICCSEEKKINIYKEIIEKYATNEKVIIKIHPRELTDYTKYFEDYRNVTIITGKFPFEILNLLDIKFKKVITIFSTAINLIENCDEKIELGYEYINNKMEKE